MKKLSYITIICLGFILCCTTKCFATTYSFADIKYDTVPKEISVSNRETNTFESLTLTQTKEDDIPTLAEYLMDPDVTRYLDRLPIEFHNLEEAKAHLKENSGLKKDSKTISYTIKLEDGTPIGQVDFTLFEQCPTYNNTINVGYWIGKPYWGRGIASEATKILSNIVINASDVDTLYIGFNPENKGSAKMSPKIFDYLEDQNKQLIFTQEIRTYPAAEYEGHTLSETKGHFLKKQPPQINQEDNKQTEEQRS